MNRYGMPDNWGGDVGGGSGNPSEDWFDANHPDVLGPQKAGGFGDNGDLVASDPPGGGGGWTGETPVWPQDETGGRGGWGNPPVDPGSPPNPGGGTGPGGDWPNFGGAPTPYVSTPWAGGPAPTFTKPGAAPTYAAYGGAVPTYRGPGAAPVFRSTTTADMESDPGYQFRLDEGNRARERGFAAGGVLLNGGTAKALARYNQEFASGEFGNVDARRRADFSAANTTYGNDANAARDQFSAENTTYGQRVANARDVFGAANTTYTNDANANQNDFNNQNTNYQTRYGQYLGDNARTLSDWLQNMTAKRNAESDYWARLSGVSGSGLSAATQGQGA